MRPASLPSTPNHIPHHEPSVKRTRERRYSWALALAITLGLITLPPSAQGQTFTVLHTFTSGADGGNPDAGVVRDTTGNLYGTTQYGGVSNFGTVFKLDSTGNETILHSFSGAPDGARPFAGLMLDAAGDLSGTTQYGGVVACYGLLPGCGTVFNVDTTGKETILYSFTGPPDGWHPYFSVLVQDAAGNLYGTTSQYGAANCYW